MAVDVNAGRDSDVSRSSSSHHLHMRLSYHSDHTLSQMSHLPFMTIDPQDSTARSGLIDHDISSNDISAPVSSSTVASNLTSSDLKQMTSNPRASKSRIPGFIAFPLAVVLTLGTSAGLYSASAQLTGFELATISRNVDEPLEIGALLGWRVFELIVNWNSGFDCMAFRPETNCCCPLTDSPRLGHCFAHPSHQFLLLHLAATLLQHLSRLCVALPHYRCLLNDTSLLPPPDSQLLQRFAPP